MACASKESPGADKAKLRNEANQPLKAPGFFSSTSSHAAALGWTGHSPTEVEATKVSLQTAV
jgi:hypothetical protein